MTKNVSVVDENGNRYVPTYAKRAKGLVKNGRARWVDENTICLACPPDDIDLEDAKMENKINPVVNIDAQSVTEEKFDAMAILKRMDRIIAQADDFANVVQQIKDLPVNTSESFGGQDGACRAEAIGNIYHSREITNQKMLDMLDKMYDDLMGRQLSRVANPDFAIVNAISKLDFGGMMPETAKLVIEAMTGKNPT